MRILRTLLDTQKGRSASYHGRTTEEEEEKKQMKKRRGGEDRQELPKVLPGSLHYSWECIIDGATERKTFDAIHCIHHGSSSSDD